MEIQEVYSLQNTVPNLELALCIDAQLYNERSYDVFFEMVRTNINQHYSLNIVGQGEFSSEDTLYPVDQTVFISNIASLHSSLCGLCQIARYKTEVPLSLANINYLGFTRDSLKSTLLSLQRGRVLKTAGARDAITAIKQKLVTLSFCWEKRLLVLMVLAYDLCLYELTAAIAELLYLSLFE